MADDYKISAKITADTSGFTNGLKNISSQLGSVSSVAKNFTSGLASAFSSGGPILVGIYLASKALKEFSAIVKETTELYKVQAKAEIQLETASKNNPLINGEAVKELKEFASQMQKISGVGDETIIQLEAQLASTGRTTEEIEKIIQTALDVSATGTMDLKTAVTQLNATMNGSIGRLGQQNDELKTLTEEELKAGKAVEILGDKYKGMAKSVADSVGSSDKLKSAWGDLKEEIGAPIEDALKPIRASIQKTVEFISGKLKELRGLREQSDYLIKAEKAEKAGNATTEQKIALLKEEKRQKEELLKGYTDQLNHIDNISASEAQQARFASAILSGEIAQRETLIKQLEEQGWKEVEISALEEETTTATVEKTKTATDVINESTDALNRQIEVAKIEAKIKGKKFTAQDEMNLRLSEYTKLLGNSEVAITEETEGMKEKKDVLLELVEAITKEAEEEERKNKAKEIAKELREKEQESLKKSLENISALKKKLSDDEISQLEEYSDLWLEKKIEQIKIEKEEALAEARRRGATKEELLLIEKSYNNEINNIYKEAEEYRNELAEEEGNKKIASVKNAIRKTLKLVSDSGKALKEITVKITKITVDVVKKSLDVIKSAFSSVFGTMKNIISDAFNFFRSVIDLNLDESMDKLLEFEDKILTFFIETLPKLPQFVSETLSSIESLIDSLLNNIDLNTVYNIIQSMFTIAGNKLPTIFDELYKLLSPLLQTLISNVSDFISSDGFVKIGLSVSDSISALLQDIFKKLANEFPNVIDNVTTVIQKAIEDATDVIKTFIDSAISILSDFIDSGSLDVLSGTLFNSIGEIINKIGNDLLGNESIKNGISQLVQNAFDSLPGIVNGCLNSVLNLIDAVVKGFNSWVENDGVSELGGAISDSLFKALTWLSSNGGETLVNIVNGVTTLLGSILEAFGKWVTEGGVVDLANGICDALVDALVWLSENGGTVIETLIKAITDLVTTILKRLPEIVLNVIKALPNIFVSIVKAIWNGIVDAIKAIGGWFADVWDWITGLFGGKKSKFTEEEITGKTENLLEGVSTVAEVGKDIGTSYRGRPEDYGFVSSGNAVSSRGGNTFNVTFNNTTDTSAYAMTKQLKTYNREMAINGVI